MYYWIDLQTWINEESDRVANKNDEHNDYDHGYKDGIETGLNRVMAMLESPEKLRAYMEAKKKTYPNIT